MKLIDADALMETIRTHDYPLRDYFNSTGRGMYTVGIQQAVDEQQTIDAVEVVHGEWIPCTKSGLNLTEMMRRDGQKWYGYKCSNCKHIYKGNALIDCKYCPNCGAKMDGKEQNDD